MEASIDRKLASLQIDHITLAQSQEYNESTAIDHTIWNMRGYACSLDYFADSIADSIESTGRCYQIVFEPFAIYYEPIIHRPDKNDYYFCRAHVYTKK